MSKEQFQKHFVFDLLAFSHWRVFDIVDQEGVNLITNLLILESHYHDGIIGSSVFIFEVESFIIW